MQCLSPAIVTQQHYTGTPVGFNGNLFSVILRSPPRPPPHLTSTLLLLHILVTLPLYQFSDYVLYVSILYMFQVKKKMSDLRSKCNTHEQWAFMVEHNFHSNSYETTLRLYKNPSFHDTHIVRIIKGTTRLCNDVGKTTSSLGRKSS